MFRSLLLIVSISIAACGGSLLTQFEDGTLEVEVERSDVMIEDIVKIKVRLVSDSVTCPPPDATITASIGTIGADAPGYKVDEIRCVWEFDFLSQKDKFTDVKKSTVLVRADGEEIRGTYMNLFEYPDVSFTPEQPIPGESVTLTYAPSTDIIDTARAVPVSIISNSTPGHLEISDPVPTPSTLTFTFPDELGFEAPDGLLFTVTTFGAAENCEGVATCAGPRRTIMSDLFDAP